jgi:plastocyanin
MAPIATPCVGPRPRAAAATFVLGLMLVLPFAPALAEGPRAEATGMVRGRVELPTRGPATRRPDVADLGALPRRSEPDRPVAVVYLESASRPAVPSEPGRARLDQRNETFVPHVLAITAGTTVDFPNSDQTYHNVFSLSRIARFDLGRYSAGRSKSVRFDRPGIVRVFCEIHSHMNAFILVFAHPFYAVTDAQGRYRIDNVPAGSYQATAWHEGTASARRPVEVPAGGAGELDFSFR